MLEMRSTRYLEFALGNKVQILVGKEKKSTQELLKKNVSMQ